MLKAHRVVASVLIFSFAASAPVPANATQDPVPVTLNPTSLRERLVDSNLSILQGMEQVVRAKDQVNVARGQILPSINLGGVLASSTGPSFVLSSVSFLLPFLLPGNWFNLRATRSMLEAQKVSYGLLELSQFASVYSLYVTHLGDQGIRESLRRQYEDLSSIHELLKRQSELLGNVSAQELYQSEAQAALALIQLSQMDSLLASERASLRAALAYPIEAQLSFEDVRVPESPDESLEAAALLDRSLELAPEKAQIHHLIEAAKQSHYSSQWAFLTGATLSAQPVVSGGATPGVSFSNLTMGGQAGFGFGYFPTVQLTADNIRQMELRIEELKIEQARVVESTLVALGEARRQAGIAATAESALERSYQMELQLYELGASTLYNVFAAHQSLTQASIARSRSRTALDLARITLHRLLLTDQFAELKGCTGGMADQGGDDGFWDWFRGIFNPESGRATMDEACRPQVATRG